MKSKANKAAVPTKQTSPLADPIYQGSVQLEEWSIPVRDMFEHILITGATGSGKTRCFFLPLIQQTLEHFGPGPERKAGALLIDGKGDLTPMAQDCLARAGRADDLFILGEGGNCSFPLLECYNGDLTRITDFLYYMLEDAHAGGRGTNESYWAENARRLLKCAAGLAKARHGVSLGGLRGIREAISKIASSIQLREDNSDDESSSQSSINDLLQVLEEGLNFCRISEEERAEVHAYISSDLAHLPPRTASTILNMGRNYLSHFSNEALVGLFSRQSGRPEVRPEDIIDRGLILLVSLSPTIYGQSADPFRRSIKRIFCERMLQRPHLVLRDLEQDRPINQIRPVLYACDEFHTTIESRGTSADALFLDRCRDFRCMCILATQGFSALQAVIPTEGILNHLINNCRTKVFFANDCPDTGFHFEKLLGTHSQTKASVTLAKTPPVPRFRLPNYQFAPLPRFAVEGMHCAEEISPRLKREDLNRLPNGEAIVVRKGLHVTHFKKDPVLYGTSP